MVKTWYNLDITGGSNQLEPRPAFMNEIREHPSLQSGYWVYNVDCVVGNYHTSKFVLIEIKSFLSEPSSAEEGWLQQMWYETSGSNCVGVYLLQHQYSGSYDGWSKLSYYDGNFWQPVISGSHTLKLNGNFVFNYIHDILE